MLKLLAKPTGMSKEQYDYALAKAAYDSHHAQHVTEAQQKEYEARYWELLNALSAAEKNLILWAKNTVITKDPIRYEQIKVCFEKPIYNHVLREQFIDICFRLKA